MIKIDLEDFKILEKYKPEIDKIIINQSCFNVNITMKNDLKAILKKYNYDSGICNCNSGIMEVITRCNALYGNNIELKDKIYGETSKKESDKGRRRKKGYV